ncbi:MAG TPA: uroporphyrinogen-III C-methyltransferase [Sulfobacillus sp.]|nr:uroporphyrinogen-III C-methyltransferase [Sulfobacillus sp.]
MGNRLTGTVYLVGAGPGDPRLLTNYAVQALAAADAVVYDRLIHPNILDLTPSYAERIYAGKEHAKASVSQDSINQLLVERAQRGQTVVRLKGGDPLLFGRGGEEAEVLRAYRIPFEIIPGLSSSMASLAYAGIPATHRGLIQGVSTVGGFQGKFSYSWQERHSWVVLMGLEHVREVVSAALDAGFPSDLAACAIEWATWGQQRTVRATLQSLPEAMETHAIESPCVLVFGENVRLSEELSWWESKPAHGQRVIVVSGYPVEWGMLEKFREQGQEVFNWSIYLSALADNDRLAAMSSHDTVFIEESALVNALVKGWTDMGRDLRDLPHLCVPAPEVSKVAAKGFSRVQVASTVEQAQKDLDDGKQHLYVTFEQFQSLPSSARKHVNHWTVPAMIRNMDALWTYHLSWNFDTAVLVSPAGEKWYAENRLTAERVIVSHG